MGGLQYPLGRGRTPLWFDSDNDGDLDVFLANDPRSDGLAPAAFFIQDNGAFTQENDLLGVNGITQGNLFAQLAWFARDASPVLVVHGGWAAYPQKIYQFDSSGYLDVTGNYGFPLYLHSTRDVAVADLNGDAMLDFYLARSPVQVKYRNNR